TEPRAARSLGRKERGGSGLAARDRRATRRTRPAASVATGAKLIGALVAAALMLAGAPSLAATDYRLDSGDWNGLSRLADEARANGCELTTSDALDWSALDGHDVLWFVYPRTAVDGARLRRYLEAGGRALLADDFGAADGALAALEIHR